LIPKEVIEDIKSKIDIVDVISEYINLQRVGSYYRALCPFHPETTPSFYVHPKLQFYHCFGCGASGDVIKFVQEMEKISFYEALEKLAKRVGVDLGKYRVGGGDYRIYTTFYENVWMKYKESLKGESRAYLKDRGFNDEEIEKYGFGYSPVDSRIPHKVAKQMNVPLEKALEYGILMRSGGTLIDRFEGRITIPIRNESGKIVAFGGRILGDGEPKYLNSPDTRYFSKSKILFMFSEAKRSIKELDFVIITEGYMDALAFHRAGVTNAVAVLGTSLTRDHLLRLGTQTKNVILCFDNDDAGVRASLKALEILDKLDFNVLVLSMEPYKDPDEFFQNEGAENLKNRLKDSVPYEIFLTKAISSLFNLKTSNGVEGFLKSMKKWANIFRKSGKIKRLDNLVREVSSIVNLPESDVMSLFSSEDFSLKTSLDRKTIGVEEELVFLYMNYEDLREDIEKIDTDVLEGLGKDFFMLLKESGDVNTLLEKASKDLKDWIFKVQELVPEPPDPRKVFKDILSDLEKKRLRKRLAEIDDMIKNSDDEEKKILLKARIDLIRRMKEMGGE